MTPFFDTDILCFYLETYIFVRFGLASAKWVFRKPNLNNSVQIVHLMLRVYLYRSTPFLLIKSNWSLFCNGKSVVYLCLRFSEEFPILFHRIPKEFEKDFLLIAFEYVAFTWICMGFSQSSFPFLEWCLKFVRKLGMIQSYILIEWDMELWNTHMAVIK